MMQSPEMQQLLQNPEMLQAFLQQMGPQMAAMQGGAGGMPPLFNPANFGGLMGEPPRKMTPSSSIVSWPGLTDDQGSEMDAKEYVAVRDRYGHDKYDQ